MSFQPFSAAILAIAIVFTGGLELSAQVRVPPRPRTPTPRVTVPKVTTAKPSAPTRVVPSSSTNKTNLSSAGRRGRQQHLRNQLNNPNVSKADKGWIKSELNQIDRGNRKSIRVPPGKELAHQRGREAAKGYSYEHSQLNLAKDHRRQHYYDKQGRLNKERPITRPSTSSPAGTPSNKPTTSSVNIPSQSRSNRINNPSANKPQPTNNTYKPSTTINRPSSMGKR
jgi:hypothetical protein